MSNLYEDERHVIRALVDCSVTTSSHQSSSANGRSSFESARWHVPAGESGVYAIEVFLATEDMSNLDAARKSIRPSTKILWAETPSNPLMKVSNLAGLAEIGHAAGVLGVVGKTIASPYLQRPLTQGADVVVHSTTKYLEGHSDVLGGAVIVNDPALADQVGFLQFAVGAVFRPMDAWLTVRGINTLAVRRDRHSANVQAIA